MLETMPASGPSVTGRLTVLEPNRVVAEIDAPSAGLVVIAEAYYPVWSATLDGEPAPIYPANVLSRAIAIGAPGHHVIEMRLRPVRFWGLLPLYLAGLLAAILAVARRGSKTV